MNTECQLDKVALLVDLAKRAKGKARDRYVAKLKRAVDRLDLQRFEAKKLRDAFEHACVKRPDFGDPVVFESNKGLGSLVSPGVLHLDGTFDVEKLAEKYFEREWRDL